MSMTKRMFESRPGSTGDAKDKSASESATRFAAFFEITEPYHHAFVKSRMREKRSHVYRLLYPHGIPSTAKFYKEEKEAGGLSGYLTYYFFSHTRKCLEELGLPPPEVEELLAKTEDARRYYFVPRDARAYAPSDEKLKRAESIQPKARYFRHGNREMRGIMHERSIQNFFTEVYGKNAPFYKKNPQALFKVELMDYEDYLQSPFWFVIRNIVLYRDGYKCSLCSAKAKIVHHISYDADVLYGKDLEPLVSLCDPCHELIEFDENGDKVSDLAAKKDRYEELLATRGTESKEKP